MPPMRLPRSLSSRQGHSQFCNPHTRARQSPGMQGSRVFHSSSPIASWILDPWDPSTFPPVSYRERSLKFTLSCLLVRASCLLGFCLATTAQDTVDESRVAHPTGLSPISFLQLPACCLPSPTPPCLPAWPGRQLETLFH